MSDEKKQSGFYPKCCEERGCKGPREGFKREQCDLGCFVDLKAFPGCCGTTAGVKWGDPMKAGAAIQASMRVAGEERIDLSRNSGA